MEIEQRVKAYWTQRSHDFGAVRRNELKNDMGKRWQQELEAHLPQRTHLRILDVGTGTGFFPILLAEMGHLPQGIDLTPAMLREARAAAQQRGLSIPFLEMDAQNLGYGDGTFDVVLSRNLTWTLPEPEQAYAQWFRVLKPGGILLNYDAEYARHVRSHSTQNCQVAPDSPYGHVGMTQALQQECDNITLELDVGKPRPAWDEGILKEIGFRDVRVDAQLGSRLLGNLDLTTAPMFGIYATK